MLYWLLQQTDIAIGSLTFAGTACGDYIAAYCYHWW